MEVECCICTNYLDDQDFKPVTGTCGHTLCINCCRSIESRKCPTCNREHAFLEEIVNYQLIDLINSLKERDAKEKADKQRLNQTGCKCSECGSLIKKDQSRLCLPCCISHTIVRHDDYKILDEQRAEKAVFCGSCALEGVHKKHKTVLYSKLKEKHSIGIGLEKVIADCEATETECARKLTNLRSAKENFLKRLKEISSKALNTDKVDGSILLDYFQEVELGYKNAICTLEEKIQDSIQEIERLSGVLDVHLPEEETSAPKIATKTLGSENHLLLNSLSRGQKVKDNRSQIQRKFTVLVGPIVDILGFFTKFCSTKMKSSLNIEKLPPPGRGRFCCAENCRKREKDQIMTLCSIYNGTHEDYIGSDDDECPNCLCEERNHKNSNNIFKTSNYGPISPSEMKDFHSERFHLINFIEEAIAFGALPDASLPADLDYLAIYLKHLCSKCSSMNEICDMIIRNAEEKLNLTRQGRRNEETPFQMEQMIAALGKLKVAGPILTKLGL